ncbi:MAG: tetratricopeptide repeat protein [Nitrososphaera sp.]|nr:tetratricopeptide repeat protein [Nitrososphaera sp.]MCI0698997.1 tetratricopeptide repeat protein [candidate division KSB1 bacterium]
MKNPVFAARAFCKDPVPSRILVILIFLFSIIGCRDKSDIEARRKAAHPKAVQFLVQAEYLYKEGRYGQALFLADSAAYYEPDLADIWMLEGMIYTQLLQFDNAEKAYKRILEIDRNYPGIHLNLGNTALRKGEPRRALGFYDGEKGSEVKASVALQKGRAYEALSRPDSAKMMYMAAIEADSTMATAYMRLGTLFKNEGELESALGYIRSGLRLMPDNPNYRYVYGSILLLNGQAAEAAAEFKTVVETQPWNYWANYSLGQALVRAQEVELGKSYLARAENLTKQVRTLQDWENLARSNPDQQGIWLNYSDVLARSGQIEKAIHAANVAKSLGPISLAFQCNLATLHMLNADTTTAMAMYRELVAIDSTFADGWLNLGVGLAAIGQTAEAGMAFRKARKYNPNDPLPEKYLKELEGRDQ